ncbi:esterase/lipase family protein [Arthrobacter sp. D1-17]
MSYQPGDLRLPIIYVRGFAGGDIEGAVEDPFYGFSTGSVHVRANRRGDPKFHQFESPMLRLMSDMDYEVRVHGNQKRYLDQAREGEIPAATIWIHRFYDVSASSIQDEPEKFSLEQAAMNLFSLIKLVRLKTGAPKVFLVAHSMGGLICRCLLQRVIPEAEVDQRAEHNLRAGEKYVASLFTYATPHGGIRFAIGGGFLERLRDFTGLFGADVFGPDRMYEYLTPEFLRDQEPRRGFTGTVIPQDGFSLSKIFCLAGSNPGDYKQLFGLSSRAVGVKSDGLVQLENAVIKDAHCAIVHRSHGGRYGIVNSEEGYQNLNRFLFGDLQVTLDLVNADVGRQDDSDLEFQLDLGLTIRGLPVLVHEQTAAHHCPILVERLEEGEDPVDHPRPLLTTFLSSKAPRPLDEEGNKVSTLRHVLNLRLMSIREKEHKKNDPYDGESTIDMRDHLEQTADWEDALVVDILPGDGASALPRAWAAWTSTLARPVRLWKPMEEGETALEDKAPDVKGSWVGEIAVPSIAHRLLGDKALIRITVIPRTRDF